LLAVDWARRERPALPVFVLGHSMGGLVALGLALERQHELRGLVLSGAAAGVPTAIEPILDSNPFPDLRIPPDGLSRDPRVVLDYDQDPLNYRGPFRRETLRMLADGARAVSARLGELELPLLILHGGADAIVPPEASEHVAGAVASRDKQLTVYPDLRHEILNEPEGPEIVSRIAAWILERA
jgi:alpha-beta hydrolase superfamily lysophospholipase